MLRLRNLLIGFYFVTALLLFDTPAHANTFGSHYLFSQSQPIQSPTPLPISFGVSEPYRSQVLVEVPEFYSTKSKQFTDIPAGKRLVIEHVSARGYVQTGQKAMIWIKISGHEYALVMHHQVSYANGKEYFSASQPMKLYVADSEGLYAFVSRTNATGLSEFSVTISGYLIDVS